MEKKNEEGLALSLFGDNPPAVKVVLDESEPKQTRDEYERMNTGDTNCACE
jgi:hypothetical protein